jgi:hypothetical protein
MQAPPVDDWCCGTSLSAKGEREADTSAFGWATPIALCARRKGSNNCGFAGKMRGSSGPSWPPRPKIGERERERERERGEINHFSFLLNSFQIDF